MIHHGLDFNFRVLNFVDEPAAAETLAKETPINRVPFLIEGTQKIYDSRVIINYLTQKHQLPPLSIEDENNVSSIYSILDAGVMLYLLKRDGIDISGPGFLIPRQRQRIPRNLESLTPLTETHVWNYPAMAMYSMLYWCNARDLIRLEDYPAHREFLARFAKTPGVPETGF